MEVGYIENAEREAHDRGDMGKIYLFTLSFLEGPRSQLRVASEYLSKHYNASKASMDIVRLSKTCFEFGDPTQFEIIEYPVRVMDVIEGHLSETQHDY